MLSRQGRSPGPHQLVPLHPCMFCHVLVLMHTTTSSHFVIFRRPYIDDDADDEEGSDDDAYDVDQASLSANIYTTAPENVLCFL